MGRAFPFLLEAGHVLLEQFALGGIVQQNQIMLRVDPGHDYVMQRRSGPGLQSNDQGPTFGEMLLEVGGVAFAAVSGGNIVAYLPSDKSDVSTWLAGDNISNSVAYFNALPAATTISTGLVGCHSAADAPNEDSTAVASAATSASFLVRLERFDCMTPPRLELMLRHSTGDA